MASANNIRAGSAYVEIGASYKQLQKGLSEALDLLQDFGKSTMAVGGGMMGGGAAVLGPIAAMTMSFADTADNLDELSARTGMTIENLSALGYAASLTGASLESVETGAKFIQKAIASAASGSDTATEAFKRLGLSVGQLSNMSPDEQFDAVAKALAAIPNQADRTALAMQVLGRSGTMLIPLIQNLDGLRQEAQSAGAVLTTDAVRVGAALKDQYDAVIASLGALKNTIGETFAQDALNMLKVLQGLVVGGIQWVKNNKDLIISIAQIAATITAAGAALVVFGGGIVAISTVMSSIGSLISGVVSIIGTLWTAIGLVVSAITAVAGTIMSVGAPAFILLFALGGLAVAAFGEIKAVLAEIPAAASSAFADLSKQFGDTWKGIRDAIAAGDITLAAEILWTSLKLLWTKGVAELTRIWNGIKVPVLNFWEDLIAGASVAWTELEFGAKLVFTVAVNFWASVMDQFLTWFYSKWNAAVGWLSKQFNRIWGMFDRSLDVEKMNQAVDRITAQKEKGAKFQLDQRELARERENAGVEQQRDKALEWLERERRKNQDQNVESANAGIYTLESERDALKRKLAELANEASKKKAAAAKPSTPSLPTPTALYDQMTKFSQAGSFSAFAWQGLGLGSSVQERTAKAAEKTAANTEAIKNKLGNDVVY